MLDSTYCAQHSLHRMADRTIALSACFIVDYFATTLVPQSSTVKTLVTQFTFKYMLR